MDKAMGLISRPQDQPRHDGILDLLQEKRYEEMAIEHSQILGIVLSLGRRTRNGLCWCKKRNRGKHELACELARKLAEKYVKGHMLCEKCWQPLDSSERRNRKHDKCPEPGI
jgi:hypothetical protein